MAIERPARRQSLIRPENGPILCGSNRVEQLRLGREMATRLSFRSSIVTARGMPPVAPADRPGIRQATLHSSQFEELLQPLRWLLPVPDRRCPSGPLDLGLLAYSLIYWLRDSLE
jgi:hypothetical protein